MSASTATPFSKGLLPGETILWRGRPRQGLLLRALDGLLIPFSLLWGGFAVFWEATTLTSKAPFFFPLFGIPFVLAGFYLIVGRFLVDAWLRARTFYALTQQRVLIERLGPWPSLRALSLNRLPDASLTSESDGRATIRFGPAASLLAGAGNRAGFGIWTPALDPTPQFLGIENADRVFAMIQERALAASA